MRILMKATLIILAVLAVACSSNPVTTDYNPKYDFAAIRTYGWMAQTGQNQDPVLYNDLTDERIHSAVDEQLALRGWKLVDKEKPDVMIAYHLGVQEQLRVTDFYPNYGYYPCYYCRPYVGAYGGGMGGYGPWGGYAGGGVSVYQYTQGTIMLDLIDSKDMHLVWRGILSKPITSLKTPQERDERINNAVQQILSNLPSL
jgi:hypothetical protein